MRHINPISRSIFSRHHGRPVYEPYESQYIDSYNNSGFKNAKPSNRYVQILQYIADHPGCKRFDVNVHLLDIRRGHHEDIPWSCVRGQYCTIFAQLLYIDLIDHDEKFRYTITPAGEKVLKTAYLNSMKDIVTRG